MDKQKKLSNTAKRFGRRKFDTRARRYSRHSHLLLSYKKNSKLREVLASLLKSP